MISLINRNFLFGISKIEKYKECFQKELNSHESLQILTGFINLVVKRSYIVMPIVISLDKNSHL